MSRRRGPVALNFNFASTTIHFFHLIATFLLRCIAFCHCWMFSLAENAPSSQSHCTEKLGSRRKAGCPRGRPGWTCSPFSITSAQPWLLVKPSIGGSGRGPASPAAAANGGGGGLGPMAGDSAAHTNRPVHATLCTPKVCQAPYADTTCPVMQEREKKRKRASIQQSNTHPRATRPTVRILLDQGTHTIPLTEA